MNIIDIITKKKNNEELNYEELSYAFNGYLNKQIPDYQMSSLLMAIVINGMNLKETISLTDIFLKSGDQYNLREKMDNVVDKHSTGGVGDTTTLIIGPMCASLGLKMAKMSGRGLGFTGGTIDKLESIPGFRVNLSKNELIEQVSKVGFANCAQSDDLTPLDKVIYALRDVTGTTESIPLIASSIMSKKIALGAENILIDVKYGSGALMKTKEDAETLSDYLKKIGAYYEIKVECLIDNMSNPLSQAIGNAIEVIEAINVLRGKKCQLRDTCIEIVAKLLVMSEGLSEFEAVKLAAGSLDSGKALNKFMEFVAHQGGNIEDVYLSEKRIEVKAKHDGVIKNIDALGAARLAAKLGASKMTLDDTIDYSVGIYLKKVKGDSVKQEEPLMTLYVNNYNVELNDEDFDFIEY
ncbi:MAG: thymidine phosphorylase [Bacilli bacterium]|nr:thymidine phosphorylase [Bacilli bacterium]